MIIYPYPNILYESMLDVILREITTGALVGVFATGLMDLACYFLSTVNLVSHYPANGLGRMASGWMRGRFIYRSIEEVKQVPYEKSIGIITHYLIGAILGSLLSLCMAFVWPNSDLILVPVAYGTSTVVFSWFLLMPSIGCGIMGRNSPKEMYFIRTSFVNHFNYGIGLSLGYVLFNNL